MTDKFIFLAQALDNSSADHIQWQGQKVSADNEKRRQEAVSLVASVVKSGTRVFDRSGVQLTTDQRRFLVEVQSVQRDVAGRMAPIACFGAYDETDDALGSSVATALETFATRIDRSIDPAHLKLVRESFRDLKKNSLQARRVRWTAAGLAALIVLGVAIVLILQAAGYLAIF